MDITRALKIVLELANEGFEVRCQARKSRPTTEVDEMNEAISVVEDMAAQKAEEITNFGD